MRIESQRDSVIQPRVAELARLPWVTDRIGFSTLKGLCQIASDGDATPLGLKCIILPSPRVVRCAANPGLMDSIPLGLLKRKIELENL
jgi:hypothetical protein